MAWAIISTYSFAMIMTEQMQPTGANKVIFRRLSPGPSYSGAVALGQMVYQPLPRIDAGRAMQVLDRPISVPNWMLALACAAALGTSAFLSAGFATDHAQTTASRFAQNVVVASNASSVWNGSTVLASSVVTSGPAADNRLAVLQGQTQSMNAELQSLQRENDALRNLSRQQGNELTTAESSLTSSQDRLKGESQDIGERLTAMQQESDGRVPGLQAALKSAADAINQIRKLLGMSSVTIPGGS